jgi:hypothetical protein
MNQESLPGKPGPERRPPLATGETGDGSTRDLSFERTARSLHIPESAWGKPEVRQFVGLRNAVKQLQMDFTDAPSGERIPSAQPPRHAGEVLGSQGQYVGDKYSAVSELLQAAVEIMEDGFKETPLREDYLATLLNRAVGPYGLSVAKRQTPPHR